MNEVARILDLYDRAMNGDAWHGDPVWRILNGVTAEQAGTRVHPGTHTIWELVWHITFWEMQVVNRLRNLPARGQQPVDFPVMPELTPRNWEAALNDLRRSNSEFRQTLAQCAPSQLDESSPVGNRPIYVEIHGAIQHNLYHAGQIAFLRKFFVQNEAAAGL